MTSNRDYLSQEEIDALLRKGFGDEDSSDSPVSTNVDDYLTAMEQDALGEIGNITFGSAATALSTLLGKKVDITTPKVSVIAREELPNEFPRPRVAVHVDYVDGFEGINLLVIETRDAQVIADLMLGGDGTVPAAELNEIHISAVQEAMNQMMGSSATSMSTLFNRFVNISPPGIDILDLADGLGEGNFPPDDVFIKVSFRLIIGDLIDSSIMQLLPVSFAKRMISLLMGEGEEDVSPASEPAAVSGHANNATASVASMGQQSNPSPSAPYAAAPPSQPTMEPAAAYQPQHDIQHAAMQQPMYQQPMGQQPMMPQPMYQQPMYQQPMYQQPLPPQQTPMYGAMADRNVQVQPVQYASFSNMTPVLPDATNLNLLLDIPLKVTVELGRTQKQIKDILELSQGSIIELDKLAGEPVDILVNNKLIAKGEVVVIDENFGVRVTDVVSQWDRIQKLQ